HRRRTPHRDPRAIRQRARLARAPSQNRRSRHRAHARLRRGSTRGGTGRRAARAPLRRSRGAARERGARRMSAPPLLLGFVAGFPGAPPPGPVGVVVASHAAEGRARQGMLVGLGAALVDTLLSGAIVLGAGPLLARLTAPPLVRAFLAAVYAVLGVMLLAE